MVAKEVDFEPLYDYCLAEVIKASETLGGIALPDGVLPDDCPRVRIVKVGPGIPDQHGNLIPVPLEPGDLVYCLSRRLNPIEVVLAGKQYVVMAARDLIGKSISKG
jgi:co-chaperonin GroES (HSP10)